MSLIPSNPAVQEKLIQLREERARVRELFRLAVLHESVTWEAELLLDLEEFREKGGFSTFQDSARKAIQRSRAHLRQGVGASGPIIQRGGIGPSNPIIRRLLGDPLETFLADKMDINKAIHCIQETTTLAIVGEPTMVTERAVLRIEILKRVSREIRDALEVEQDEQDAKDRAIVEGHRLAQQALWDLHHRGMRGGKKIEASMDP